MTPKQAKLLHNTLVGAATAGSIVLVNMLQKFSATLATGPVTVKAITVGTLVAIFSSVIGTLVSSLASTDDTASK